MSINDIIGQVGLGGNAGFEIQTDTAIQPYEVITKALVKDEVTQEVKLLIATSRTNSASSTAGTMALDVFPLQGRPHLKDLVAPVWSLKGDTSLVQPIQISNAISSLAINAGEAMAEIKFVAVKGTEPYSWFSNNLPAGLFLDIDGTLHGTPLVLGTYGINIAVSDSTSPAYIATQVFPLIVSTNLTLNNMTLPNAIVGLAYSQSLDVSGGIAPYTWELDSSLGNPPLGISVVDGVLTGWPVTYNSTTDFTAPFTFGVRVIDSLEATVSQTYSINLLPATPSIGPSDTLKVYIGSPTKIAIPVYGGQAPYKNLLVTTNMEPLPVFKSPFIISF